MKAAVTSELRRQRDSKRGWRRLAFEAGVADDELDNAAEILSDASVECNIKLEDAAKFLQVVQRRLMYRPTKKT